MHLISVCELHPSSIEAIVAVIADELKEAVVAMMMRKEEVEEQMKFVFVVFRVYLN